MKYHRSLGTSQGCRNARERRLAAALLSTGRRLSARWGASEGSRAGGFRGAGKGLNEDGWHALGPEDLTYPGIEPRSPTLQADSLPTEL